MCVSCPQLFSQLFDTQTEEPVSETTLTSTFDYHVTVILLVVQLKLCGAQEVLIK